MISVSCVGWRSARKIVYLALWQTLDAITLGTWILSVGWLIKPSVALSAGCWSWSVSGCSAQP